MEKNNEITCMLYRYESLLQAIDFLTQRFNEECITGFAYDFTNEILTLKSSALFIREGNDYVLKNKKGYQFDSYVIPGKEKIHHIALLHGNTISGNFQSFFQENDIKALQMKLVIPLIIDDYLLGFIVTDGKNIGDIDASDIKICQALLGLFKNSLENSRVFADLKEKNKILDEKIFNLFAINQSVKSLLSEMDLSKINNLAIDIFSELTGSRVTSFGTYDERTKNIKVEGYKNTSNHVAFYTEIELQTRSPLFEGSIFHIERDEIILKTIFVNFEEFHELEAEYIVLVKKDSILGVVTLSDSVFSDSYHSSTFELIETLASFTYIALNNAMLFSEIHQQKEIISKNLNYLSNLNNVIKTINQSEDLEDLFERTLETLSISFGVKKAFFLTVNNKGAFVSSGIGIESPNRNILIDNNSCWQDAFLGESVYDFRASSVKEFFQESDLEWIGETNCTVISPIYKETYYHKDQPTMLGFLVVLETSQGLKNEEVLLIDTIAKNISPIVYHMNKIKKIKNEYVVDSRKKLIKDLEEIILESKEWKNDFYLYYKRIEANPFEETLPIAYQGEEYYKIDNFIFYLSYHDYEEKDMSRIPCPNSILEFLDYFYECY